MSDNCYRIVSVGSDKIALTIMDELSLIEAKHIVRSLRAVYAGSLEKLRFFILK